MSRSLSSCRLLDSRQLDSRQRVSQFHAETTSRRSADGVLLAGLEEERWGEMNRGSFARFGFAVGVAALLVGACGSSTTKAPSTQSSSDSSTSTSPLGVGVYRPNVVAELCPGSTLDVTTVSKALLSGGGVKMSYLVQQDSVTIGITCAVGFKVGQWSLQKGSSEGLWGKAKQRAIYVTGGSGAPTKLSVCSWPKPQSHYNCPL